MNLVNVDYEKSEKTSKIKKNKKKKTKKSNHSHSKKHGYFVWNSGNGKYAIEPITYCEECGNNYLGSMFPIERVNINLKNIEILNIIGNIEENVNVFKAHNNTCWVKNVYEGCEFIGKSIKQVGE